MSSEVPDVRGKWTSCRNTKPTRFGHGSANWIWEGVKAVRNTHRECVEGTKRKQETEVQITRNRGNNAQFKPSPKGCCDHSYSPFQCPTGPRLYSESSDIAARNRTSTRSPTLPWRSRPRRPLRSATLCFQCRRTRGHARGGWPLREIEVKYLLPSMMMDASFAVTGPRTCLPPAEEPSEHLFRAAFEKLLRA